MYKLNKNLKVLHKIRKSVCFSMSRSSRSRKRSVIRFGKTISYACTSLRRTSNKIGKQTLTENKHFYKAYSLYFIS